MINKRALLFEV